MPKSKQRNGKSDFFDYFNPEKPGSFSGVSGFLKNNKSVNKNKFQKWAESQPSITLHKTALKHYPRRKVLVFAVGDLLQVDLIDFQMFSSQNNGYKYILVGIDAFSKYAYAVPIKRKTAKNVLQGLKTMVKDIQPRTIQSDQGMEFMNKTVAKWLEKKHIKLYATYNYEIKACIIERFIRTFKSRLFRYFTEKSTHKYINVLSKIIKSYNNSFHRSIRMTPEEAKKPENESRVSINLNHPKTRFVLKNPKFKINDAVRISRYPTLFQKSYTQNFSQEYFYIDSIEKTLPRVYKLRDLSGEVLMGTFYEQELEKISINSKTPFKIQAVLAEKNNRVLVKYLGWPSKFNEWIHKSKLQRL